jgi:integrase
VPKANLTDISVKRLKAPASGQVTFWDANLDNFGCRISQGGSRTFIVLLGSGRRYTIGRYPIITLQDARTEAKRILAQRTLGSHRSPAITFKDALDLFITTHCEQHNKPSTAKETERTLRNHFLKTLRSRSLSQITTHHLSAVIDRLVFEQHPSAANHAFTAIRTFFRWAVRRRYIPHSPCEGMRLPTRPRQKDRVLDDADLGSVWRAAEEYGYPFGTIVQLLLCTAQRRGEISSLKWNYLNFDNRTITLPDTKNNRPHTFPLGDRALRILQNVPKLESDYLFPARGKNDRPFIGWSKGKKALDKKCGVDYDLHDLRRTAASGMAKLGVQLHVISKLLNHVSGTAAISGVSAVYNRHAYMDEMRVAVNAWEAHLTAVLKSH